MAEPVSPLKIVGDTKISQFGGKGTQKKVVSTSPVCDWYS